MLLLIPVLWVIIIVENNN